MQTQQATYNFDLKDAALAYAVAAERILNDNIAFVEANEAFKPIIVSHLFQSIEASLKHTGIASELFTSGEARSPNTRSGHGVKELAMLATDRLGSKDVRVLIMALTCQTQDHHSQDILNKMIMSSAFERTRDAYAKRRLGYAEVRDGDFCIITPITSWIASVKNVAHNLDYAVKVIRQWKASPSQSTHFAVWFRALKA
ncbi:MAG: hypothetical protein A2498_01795 [Lentisphaerae bacterium RIFOXYC12_FULL_60_16]|nr:MAG: hypothetical protein A2498_01795 [Lentisphaerae bacterium RIFOXYC12_FULL_60_16]